MQTKRIDVTSADIVKAKATSSNPISLAIKRAYKTSKVRVYPTLGTVNIRGNYLVLPSNAQKFLSLYSTKSSVSPFSFTLLPKE